MRERHDLRRTTAHRRREETRVVREWTRAIFQCNCGGCGNPIYVGQPMLRFRVESISRPLARCLQCADEPVPKDLPTLEQLQPAPIRPTGQSRLPLSRISEIAERFD